MKLARVGFCLLLLSCAFSVFSTFSQEVLITELSKSANGQWQVAYKSLSPVTSITFAITKDDSRAERWQLNNPQFELLHIGGRDIVTRKDNQPFSEVSFKLTSSYIHLPKYYAPFARFSDGGLLLHSARFFACPNLCTGLENAWYFELTVNRDEHIVLNGKQHQGQVRWWDKNDGTKVYIGANSITEQPSFYSVIDQGLDTQVSTLLLEFFPKMMTHLSMQFGALPTKPMLFASFEYIDDGRSGRQGGVLPNQVFMHWYGKEQTFNNIYEVLWFYAHEAGHLYQGELKQFSGEQSLAWIHEGHADMLAYELLSELLPESQSYLNKRQQQAENRCQRALTDNSLSELAALGRYQGLYDCGFSFYWFIKQKSGNKQLAYQFWRDFVTKLKQGEQLTAETFLLTAQGYLSEQDYVLLAARIN